MLRWNDSIIIHLFLEVYDSPYLFREILSDISVMVITSIYYHKNNKLESTIYLFLPSRAKQVNGTTCSITDYIVISKKVKVCFIPVQWPIQGQFEYLQQYLTGLFRPHKALRLYSYSIIATSKNLYALNS